MDITSLRNEEFQPLYALSAHFRGNKERYAPNQVQKSAPIQCHNIRCIAIISHEADLRHHLKYNFHLTLEARGSFSIHEDDNKINRKYTKQLGIRNKDITIANGNVKYRWRPKIWEGTICHKTGCKYNRRKILNPEDTRHTYGKNNYRHQQREERTLGKKTIEYYYWKVTMGESDTRMNMAKPSMAGYARLNVRDAHLGISIMQK